jgi:hypothetical protein
MAIRCLRPVLSLCSVLAAVGMLAPAHGYADAGSRGPFLGLSGQWSGAGTITMADGSTERLRCKSANAVKANGRAIQQNLRCASDRFRLDVTSNVVSADGSLFGSWAEKSHGVWGSVSGRASGSAILANVAGIGFAASMYVRTKGDREAVAMQSFRLRPHRGTDGASISVALHKRPGSQVL